MKLEDYRKEKKLTYQDLSDALGISLGTVHTLCNGQKNRLLLDTAQKIHDYTEGQVTFTDLLCDRAKEEASQC